MITSLAFQYLGMNVILGSSKRGGIQAFRKMVRCLQLGESIAITPDGPKGPKEKVKEAFKIILSDNAVKGILVNIFGGIMRCDIIAEGVVAAASDLALDKPLVVRLSGTNVEKGKEILSKSDLQIISADDLDDAAEKIVKAVKG